MDRAVSESRDYFNERLHDRQRQGMRLRLGRTRRVTRRICLRIERGATEVIPEADSSMVVRCARGSLWITHDRDPKDVILDAQQTYQAEREDTMRMHALAPCVVEIEFEDEVLQ